MNPFLRRLLAAPAWIYRLHCGRLLGNQFLLLIHTGRRSGRRYRTVLEVMHYRPEVPEAVVMSGWGRKAGWLRNIEASRQAEIIIGTRHFVASHRVLAEVEAIHIIAEYEQKRRFAAPLIRWVLGRLLGWRYQGSDDDRRRLAAQLPLVAFSPR